MVLVAVQRDPQAPIIVQLKPDFIPYRCLIMAVIR